MNSPFSEGEKRNATQATLFANENNKTVLAKYIKYINSCFNNEYDL